MKANDGVFVSDNVKTAAQKLADQHYRLQPEIVRILAFGGNANATSSEPIRLLEVNDELPPSGMAMPLGFKAMPASGIPYSSVIVSVTSGEFELIQKNEMPLPPGWDLKTSFSLPRPTDDNA